MNCFFPRILGVAALVAFASSAHSTDASSKSETVRGAIVPGSEGQADSPVPVPPLAQYAALWERSMFTTHELPAPDLPKGPGFADGLTLAGVYEVDGAVVGVIMDQASSLITEVRIGSENENGIRIKTVDVGESPDKTRLQLQKGTQFGWIGFADAMGGGGAAGPAMTPGVAVPGPRSLNRGRPVPPAPSAPGQLPGAPAAVSAPPAAPPPPAPAAVQVPAAETAPAPMPATAPPAPASDDIPLPPR
ncbi:MAG: hypothetical protein KDK99_12960 [Verrucomicrobiales bacterium]|nr:hypothetical protein [Verrucomicrobiales bacterium]